MKRMNFTYGTWFLLLLGSWASVQAQVDGGVVLTEAGEDTTYYCVAGMGGASAMVAFDSSQTMGSNFQYVVTDNQGIILGLPPADMVDFAPAGPGECWVWGLSYEGTLDAMVGDDATTATLATGNFDLSDDFVVVFRDSVDGGMVMTESGEDTVYYCVSGSGGPTSAFKFDSMLTAGPNFTYVVTDNQGTILALPGGDMVDVGPAGVGECWVWGLSYTGNVLAQAGDNAAQVALTDGCYDLSDNYVVTFRDSVEGGMVMTESGEDTVYHCVSGSGGPTSAFKFDSMLTAGPNFTYVVTDNQGTILALPGGDMVDVGPAGVGECWVWGLSYTGNVLAQAGDNAAQVALTDGCYDLSDNYVVTFRDSVEGGMVMTESGEDTVYHCVSGSGGPTSAFKFDSMLTAGPNFTYVVTDNQGTILALPGGDMVDVGPAGVGECWVWGLSYTGNVLAQAGDNAAQVALTDGCYDLSDNYVVTFRDSVDGGMVSIADTATQITTCPTDGEDDILDLSTTGVSPTSYQYVVTDDQGTILALPPGPQANLEGAGQGICRIYGLAHTGDLMAQPGMDVNSAMATGCYELSENFITVDRDTASCSTTGLFNVEQDLALSLRPVPATDRLNVSVELPSTAAGELRIVNLQGQTLHAERIAPTAGPASVELSVTELPAGIYLLEVRSEGRRGWARFSKE